MNRKKKKKKKDLLLLSSQLAPAPLIRFWLHFKTANPLTKPAAWTGAGGGDGEKAAVWYKFGEGR